MTTNRMRVCVRVQLLLLLVGLCAMAILAQKCDHEGGDGQGNSCPLHQIIPRRLRLLTEAQKRPARVPRADEMITYAQSAGLWTERAKHHMQEFSTDVKDVDREVMAEASEHTRRALFHAPHKSGLWRNLGLTLGKMAQHHMENKGNFRIARESMQEGAAAYRMASYLGDAASAEAGKVLKDDVFYNYFGQSQCIDSLEPNCRKMDDILNALEKIKNPTTAAEGIRWLCNGASSLVVRVTDEEKESGRIKVATLERAHAILKVCGVVVIEDAIQDHDMLDRAKDVYHSKTREEMALKSNQPGVQERGEGRWEVTLPLEKPFISSDIIANPYVLPVIKSLMQTASIEIDTFGNLLSFPQSGPQTWHRDVADTYTPAMDNSTTMNTLPPHGVVMMVPLANLKLNHGPTEFALGSHMAMDIFGVIGLQNHYKKLPRVKLPMKKGSVCLMDIRVQHQGTPNLGKKSIRQLLYISYVNQWFSDRINDNRPYSREFDYLPTSVHQKLLNRLDTRTYIKALEYALMLKGVKLSEIKSRFIFDREMMEV